MTFTVYGDRGAGESAVRSGGLALVPWGHAVDRSDDIEVIQDLANQIIQGRLHLTPPKNINNE